MKGVVWVSSLLLAFAAGWWVGRQPERGTEGGSAGSGAVPASPPAGARPTADGSVALEAAAGTGQARAAGSREALSRGNWEPALEQIDSLARRGLPEQALELRNALLEQARNWAAAGRQPLAEALLRDYVARNPHDPEGWLELSHVLQMRGLVEPAMEPLLEALRSADEPDAVARLRDALRLLVNVREAGLTGRQDLPGLIRFYEWLTLEDPGYDGHRLKLARWLLLAGRLDEADRVLAQTGLAGVTAEARGDLEAEIRVARSGLPVRREGRAMHVDVIAAGRPVRLLVDTGASTTALSRQAAGALNSEATGRSVRVRTAGGTVTADVHRIRDLQVGELRVPSLEVLVLEHGPPGAEGLLGMDVLERFPGLSGPGAGLGPGPGGLPTGPLGRPPSSG